jgi:hypothetical protein
MLLDREASPATVADEHLTVEADARGWALSADDPRDAACMRRAFREYLEQYADSASDLHAAETVYGELVGNCVAHAPSEVRVEFRWHDRTLAVTDAADRLRTWPFSSDDMGAETTHHAYALISALTDRIHVARDADGRTRASVVLPVRRPAQVPVIRSDG